MSFEAYNLRLRRKEQIQNPHFEVTQTSRGPRYFVKGTGSDGTKLSRLVSKSDYERMKGGMRSPMMSPVRSPVRNTGYVSPRVSTRRSPTRKSPARMSPRALGPRCFKWKRYVSSSN